VETQETQDQSRKHEIWKERKRARVFIKPSSFVFSRFRAFVIDFVLVFMPQRPDLDDKKDIDKVSFAGIFNELLNLVSAFETLAQLVSPEMPFGRGLRKGGDSHNRGYWQS
jgi:hypothetical protein